jgi:hypothetical protein
MGISYQFGGVFESAFSGISGMRTRSPLAAAILPNRFFNMNYTLTMAVGCSELLILDDPVCNAF